MKYEDRDVRSDINTYHDTLVLPGGYSHSLPDTLQMIDLYYNSQFKTGKFDSQGFRKFFYNIIKPACDIATKFVDLDTNNIVLQPASSGEEMALKVWFMERRLRQWLRDKDFASLLNEIAFDYPKYGSVVIKKMKDSSWKKVLLQNLRLDPSAESLDKSPFVYELIIMSRGEVEDMPWDAEAKAELLAGTNSTFHVYECYHKEGKKWEKTVRADLYNINENGTVRQTMEAQYTDKNKYVPSKVLAESYVKELPYRELHWEKVPGRWLGYGFSEYLEENQIATNEAENLERAGLKFTSLKLYQTRDDSIGGSNILTSSANGDILKIDSEITAIPMEERNLAAFNNTRANWQSNTERKTFTTDITTGANLPSRTPLGVANLQASLATSYFELKRENFGIFIRKLVEWDIMPDFKKDQVKQHSLIFQTSDKDIDKLDQLIAETHLNEYVVEYAYKTGFFPSKIQVEAEKQKILDGLKRQKNRGLEIPDNFYDNAKYTVHTEITGEGLDVGARGQVLQLALTTIGQNPAILQNPVTKNIFFQFLSLGGVSPAEIDALQAAAAEVPPQVPGMEGQMPQGGSIARPQPNALQGTGAQMIG